MSESTAGIDPRRLHLVGRHEALRSLASAMVMSMPQERRAVFALAIAERLSYRDIARRLEIAEDTVKHHVRDGLATMYQDVMAQPAVLGSPRNGKTPPLVADEPPLRIVTRPDRQTSVR